MNVMSFAPRGALARPRFRQPSRQPTTDYRLNSAARRRQRARDPNLPVGRWASGRPATPHALAFEVC